MSDNDHLSPLAEVARVIREESDALILVDTVSSLAGAPVETDAWVFATTVSAQNNNQQNTIAYIRNGTEIRLIEPDGSNDRRLWTHADARPELGIYGLAWRPDRKEIAFSSGHAAVASLYHSDLYAIHPDGSGFRKLTNTPDRGEYARFPKGSVTVTVRNDQPIYQQTQASAGIFMVYVAGADEPQSITLPPGATKTVVFKSVADFGNVGQAIVAMFGSYRWFIPGVDVVAGRAVKAPLFSISGDGRVDNLAAHGGDEWLDCLSARSDWPRA